MQRTVIFTLILLSSWPLFSQVPGYLGKRLSATFNFQTMLAVNGPTYKNKGQERFGDSDGTAFSNRFELGVSYVFTRDIALIAAIERSRTGVYIDLTNPQTNEFVNQFYQLKNTSILLGMRKFVAKKGALAPFGIYQGVGLKITRPRGSLARDIILNLPGRDETDAQEVGIDKKQLLYYLAADFGSNRIIADRFLLNFSLRINLPLNLRRLGKWIDSTEPDGTIAQRNQEEYEQRVFQRMLSHSIVMVNVGVGYLIR